MTALLPDVRRLTADWEAMAGFRDPTRPGWERRVFSEPYARSREWLAERMRDAGLTVDVDGAGNVIGTLAGSDPDLPALVTGSHTDTVGAGGRFDGIIGVLGAIEAVRLLAERDQRLRHPLRIIDFLGEEANDFGLSCIGSRAIAGALTAAVLGLTDARHLALGDALARLTGQPPEAALAAAWSRDDVSAFVELHIEQARRLEAAGVPIGVVSAIAGIQRINITVTGRPDHAGTTTMTDRRDALAGAAEVMLAIERLARDAGEDAVATTGRIAVEPGSINVVPGRVQLWAEFRSTDASWLDDLDEALQQQVVAIGERRDVSVESGWTGTGRPVPTTPAMREAVEGAARSLGYETLVVPSGAGHDAAFMARLGPMAMVFVPSRDGRSHCPEEWTDLEQVADGVAVLTQTLIDLDARLD